MDYGHPLQFGVRLTPRADAPSGPVELARLAESLGYDLVAFAASASDPAAAPLDVWTLMSWTAARTDSIRIVPHGLDASQRPPAVVARAAASLDLMARGRVELALSAPVATTGPDAEASALTDDDAVQALGEAVDVVRGVWDTSGGPLHLRGAHHTLLGAQRGPAPAHRMAVWISGTGAAALGLAGRTGDGWWPTAALASLDQLRAEQALVDAAASEAGRDPREIRRLVTVEGQPSPGEGDGFLRDAVQRWVDDLVSLVVEDGISTIVLASEDPAVMRRFAEQVVPGVREAVARTRSARGTAERVMRSAAVRAARRPGIDYDAVPASLVDTAVEPGDVGYGAARSTYLRGGSPGLVLYPVDDGQVAEALGFARAQAVPMSVRSGGHGISGRSTNDGGIILDVGRMNAIEVVDAATRRVRIGPGARWGEVAAALRPRGWAISSGDYGGVGVGGLATAGGIGFLVREHGLTIDHLRAVDMVLADGSSVRASQDENADLFWGVRGAGANLGIVTSFELEAAEVGDVGFAQLVIDASDTADVLQQWGAYVEGAPRDLTAFLIMGPPRGGQMIAQIMAVVNSDDPDTVIDRLQPFAAMAPLLQQRVQIVPYDAVVSLPDGVAHAAQGEPVSRSGMLEHLTADFAADATRLLRSGEAYFFQIRAAGGAVGDVDPDATAYAHRSASFHVAAFGGDRRRLDAIWDGMGHHFSGIYGSFETDPRPERIAEVFPSRTLARLQGLKRRYDPDDVFRHNLSVAPRQAIAL